MCGCANMRMEQPQFAMCADVKTRKCMNFDFPQIALDYVHKQI
jgi:hypothetical protein